MWSESKSRMLEQNVQALIISEINSDSSRCDFYEKTKFLKKVLSTKKYNWANA